jgi:hypothetical protein
VLFRSQTPESGQVLPDTTLTWNAGTPPTGWHFLGWTSTTVGLVVGEPVPDAIRTTPPTEMPNESLTVWAVWGDSAGNYGQPDANTLTVNNTPIAAPADQTPESGQVLPDTTLTWNAGTPPTGWNFLGWTSTNEGLVVGEPVPDAIRTTPPTAMPNESLTVWAVWGDSAGNYGQPDTFTLTFHLYTANEDIINRFLPYTTGEVNGRRVVTIPVTPGAPRHTWEGYDLLADALAIGNIYGVANTPGHAFWGWFTDATLNGSGRTNATSGLRRPALHNICQIYEGNNLDRGFGDRLLMSIENANSIFAIYNLFGNQHAGNIDLYAIWSLWGDVNDDDYVDIDDVGLLRNHVMMRDMPGVVIQLNQRAGDVLVDQHLDIDDVGLLRNYVMMRDMPGVRIVLGASPAQ